VCLNYTLAQNHFNSTGLELLNAVVTIFRDTFEKINMKCKREIPSYQLVSLHEEVKVQSKPTPLIHSLLHTSILEEKFETF